MTYRRGILGCLIIVTALVAGGIGPALAQATGRDLVGTFPPMRMTARATDTLADIAVDRGVGYTELVIANPTVDRWLPGQGTTIILPTAHLLPDAPRRGIIINLPEQRLYYLQPGREVITFPIGIGTEGADIRTGSTSIVLKRRDPTWIPTANERKEDPELPAIVPPGPDNPMGQFALNLGWTAIAIHGTNRDFGIGRRVSHGCFRLYNPDIKALFDMVSRGTPVTVVDQPIKLGWHDSELYIEVHPTVAQTEDSSFGVQTDTRELPDPVPLVNRAAGARLGEVDWGAVQRAVRLRNGLPTPIFQRAAAAAASTDSQIGPLY